MTTEPRSPSVLGRAVAAAGLIGLTLFAGGSIAAPAGAVGRQLPAQTSSTSASPTPVTLSGEGSWDPYRELTNWQNDLFGASGLVNLGYTPTGGFQGREDYVAGKLDFVISGNPFTSSELGQLSGGSGALIEAPVFVSALAFAVVPPLMQGVPVPSPSQHGWDVFRQPCDDGNDGTPPTYPDNPAQCDAYSLYSGPINLPPENLAAMLFGQPGSDFSQNDWDDPAVLDAWGITQGSDYAAPQLVPGPAGPDPFIVMRSDPSETNYYLQEYIQKAAPDIWSTLEKKGTQEGQPVEPVVDRLPDFFSTLAEQTSRQGVDQQALFSVEPSGSNLANNAEAQGVIAPVPPGALAEMSAVNVPVNGNLANVDVDGAAAAATFAAIQNGAGQYVTPTPANIDAAVNAVGDQPLGALTDSVHNAYPLTYVDNLYAPAHGLSIDKTEALATMIRYLATAGQSYDQAQGDGQLSPALVNQALAAANEVVISNCVGSGTLVVSNSAPGSYAPAGTLTNIGPMLHCTQAPASTPTTVAGTTTTLATSSSIGGSSSGPLSQTVSESPSGTSNSLPQVAVGSTSPGVGSKASSGNTAKEGAGSSGGSNLAVSLTKLPLQQPGTGPTGFDRLTTMVVGALLLVLIVRGVKAMARAMSP
jgi:ABC-type phosphate transport system substrate-binding protein